jgi:hypothetical protein
MGGKRKPGARRRPACVWGGTALAVAGLCVALVAWVGLDRANSYLGVAASAATVLGLALGVYGAVGQKGNAAGIRLDLRHIEVGGNNRTAGRVGKASGADISVTIRDAKISGNSTVIGETDGSADFPGKALCPNGRSG